MKKILTNLFLSYLRFFAKLRIKRVKPLIVGVGGSSGKSSTALLISQILKDKFKVLESKGKNSQTGIPLSILGIGPGGYSKSDWLRVALLSPVKAFKGKTFDVFVIEMGIDSPFPPNNMDYLLRIVRPNISVLTNVSLEHSVFFDPLVKDRNKAKEEILSLTAKEELKLIKSVGKEGASIVNMDNPFIKEALNSLSSNVISVSSKDKSATFYIKEIDISIKNFVLVFEYKGKEHRIFLPQALPSHFAYSILLSLAASVSCGMNLGEAISSLKHNFRLPPGRLSVFKGIKNSVIIDSSYNSSLDPAVEVLEMASVVAKGRRKLGVLGDMRELGSMSKSSHELLAKAIMKNLDFAILIGPEMLNHASPILKKNNFPHMAFDTFDKARYRITDYIEEKDLVVVKGSQNTLFLERVVETLLLDKRDSAYLCRRGEHWDKKRGIIAK